MEFARFPRTVPGEPGACRSPKTLRDRIGNHRTETALGFRRTRPLVHCLRYSLLHRKEVIHPHVLVGIPCFDLTPITGPALGAAPPFGSGWRLRALQAFMV